MRLRRLLWLGALVCVLGLVFSAANADVSGVIVTPTEPTTADSISVRVVGWFGDACWSADSATWQPITGPALRVDVFTHDVWVPGYNCLAIVVDYSFELEGGRLPAGDYTLTVTEMRQSLRDPFPRTMTVDFTVLGTSATNPATWGEVKAGYRR